VPHTAGRTLRVPVACRGLYRARGLLSAMGPRQLNALAVAGVHRADPYPPPPPSRHLPLLRSIPLARGQGLARLRCDRARACCSALQVGGEAMKLFCCGLSADSRYAVAGQEDGRILLWDLTAKSDSKPVIPSLAVSRCARSSLSSLGLVAAFPSRVASMVVIVWLCAVATPLLGAAASARRPRADGVHGPVLGAQLRARAYLAAACVRAFVHVGACLHSRVRLGKRVVRRPRSEAHSKHNSVGLAGIHPPSDPRSIALYLAHPARTNKCVQPAACTHWQRKARATASVA
jgi:hypothetical protein